MNSNVVVFVVVGFFLRGGGGVINDKSSDWSIRYYFSEVSVC